MGFDIRSECSDGNLGRNVIIFRADIISSFHVDNKIF